MCSYALGYLFTYHQGNPWIVWLMKIFTYPLMLFLAYHYHSLKPGVLAILVYVGLPLQGLVWAVILSCFLKTRKTGDEHDAEK
jgi:hypothetical protein